MAVYVQSVRRQRRLPDQRLSRGVKGEQPLGFARAKRCCREPGAAAIAMEIGTGCDEVLRHEMATGSRRR